MTTAGCDGWELMIVLTLLLPPPQPLLLLLLLLQEGWGATDSCAHTNLAAW